MSRAEFLTLAPGSDRIPVELFQILKDDAVESAALNMQYARNMHSICNMPAPGKKLFKEWIPDNHSVVVPEGITKCTDTWYQGTLYHYSIANVSLICQFHVLPIVFRDEHWLFHFTGNYLDFDNHMHLLTDFDKATKRLGLRL